MSKELFYREPIDVLVDWRDEHPDASPKQLADFQEAADQFAVYEHLGDKSICVEIARLCVAQLNAPKSNVIELMQRSVLKNLVVVTQTDLETGQQSAHSVEVKPTRLAT